METVKEEKKQVAKTKRVRKPMTKERRLALDIVQGLREVAQAKAGKIKLQSWDELYAELKNEDKNRSNEKVCKRTKRVAKKA